MLFILQALLSFLLDLLLTAVGFLLFVFVVFLFLCEQEKLAGRNKDKRHHILDDPTEKKEDDGIVLTYKDEFGRDMTEKEAFRVLSHKFHGRGPGKKKQEQVSGTIVLLLSLHFT